MSYFLFLNENSQKMIYEREHQSVSKKDIFFYMKKWYFFPSIILVLFLLVWAARWTQIKTGNVGVSTFMGQTNPQELVPGVYFPLPFLSSIKEYTTKEIVVTQNDLRPKSRDNLTMEDIDVDIYYSVNPVMVADLFIKYQGDIGEKDGVYTIGESRVTREVRESVFKAVSQMDATTMHTRREELGESIVTLLQQELNKSDKEAFFITSVNVKSLVTDRELEKSIRERAKVDQDINAVEKRKELAKKEAERLKEEALGIATANNIISSSMTPSLERIKIAEIQRETALAVAGKQGNTVLLQGGTTPIVNLK